MKARAIVEAEAKRLFKNIRISEVPPGDDYFLAIGPEPIDVSRTKDEEYCPFRVEPGNKFTQLDGTYTLAHDVEQALLGPQGTELERERIETESGDALESYLLPIHRSLSSGITSGVQNGVAGPRYWTLVWWPNQDKQPEIVSVYPRKPGEMIRS